MPPNQGSYKGGHLIFCGKLARDGLEHPTGIQFSKNKAADQGQAALW